LSRSASITRYAATQRGFKTITESAAESFVITRAALIEV
jgi:hypothetical protein